MVLPQIDFQEQSIPFFYKYLVRRNYLSVLPDEKNHPSWQQETVKYYDDDWNSVVDFLLSRNATRVQLHVYERAQSNLHVLLT